MHRKSHNTLIILLLMCLFNGMLSYCWAIKKWFYLPHLQRAIMTSRYQINARLAHSQATNRISMCSLNSLQDLTLFKVVNTNGSILMSTKDQVPLWMAHDTMDHVIFILLFSESLHFINRAICLIEHKQWVVIANNKLVLLRIKPWTASRRV